MWHPLAIPGKISHKVFQFIDSFSCHFLSHTVIQGIQYCIGESQVEISHCLISTYGHNICLFYRSAAINEKNTRYNVCRYAKPASILLFGPLQPIVQCAPRHAQHLRGNSLIAIGALHRFRNQHLFRFFEGG